MTHVIKTESEYFEQVYNGIKTFEIRKNDRGYQVGDILKCKEISGCDKHYTGRCCIVSVVCLESSERFCKSGYVVLGIKKIESCDMGNSTLLPGA